MPEPKMPKLRSSIVATLCASCGQRINPLGSQVKLAGPEGSGLYHLDCFLKPRIADADATVRLEYGETIRAVNASLAAAQAETAKAKADLEAERRRLGDALLSMRAATAPKPPPAPPTPAAPKPPPAPAPDRFSLIETE